jgi:NADPH-dependent glutamate synthase beta subunit-like oxidoreductase
MPDPINIAAVAVLGFGPAGVSAAAALVETGVRVTTFNVEPRTLTVMANADRVARRLARRLIAHNP